MRIAAWNLQGRTTGWEWLDRNAIDLMLLNEVRPMPGRDGVWPTEPVHAGEGWRSALVTALPCEPLREATPTYRDKAKATLRVFSERRPDEPWQNDYIFVSQTMSDRLTFASVVSTDETFGMSDHAPFIVEFE